MHLLYLDESGAVDDPNQQHFVLAGVAVFERKTHWIEQELKQIAARFSPNAPHDIELHGSPMRSGREGWKAHKLPDRLDAIKEALHKGVAAFHPNGIRLFAPKIMRKSLSFLTPKLHA